MMSKKQMNCRVSEETIVMRDDLVELITSSIGIPGIKVNANYVVELAISELYKAYGGGSSRG